MSASRPIHQTPATFEGEVIPWDEAGYPLVFWSKGHPRLCAACATKIARDGGKVVVYFRLEGGFATCSRCDCRILAVEDEEGDGDCDAETVGCEDDPMELEPWQWRFCNAYNFDPTNTDWEEDRADWEPEEEAEDGGDDEASPPVIQQDWKQFEVQQ